MSNIKQVAKYLIENGYLLTGLELLQEGLEKGVSTDLLSVLIDYFGSLETNHGLNQYIDDSLSELDGDVSPYILSVDKDGQKRIKLLEYELRKEREAIQTLRGELQSFVSPFLSIPDDYEDSTEKQSVSNFERKMQHYIITSYLMDNNYKLTAIALSQEVEDPMSWEEMKNRYTVNDYEPPTFKDLYNYFIGGGVNKYDFGFSEKFQEVNSKYEELVVENQTLSDKNKQLHEQLMEIQNKLEDSQEKVHNLESTIHSLNEQVEHLQSLPQETKIQYRDIPNEKLIEDHIDNNIDYEEEPVLRFRNLERLLSPVIPNMPESSSRISKSINDLKNLTDDSFHSLIKVLSDSLPHLKSGVILNKREELLPLLLCAVRFNDDPDTRVHLTEMLFNLIPIPNEIHRKMIMDGCIWVAELTEKERTSNELLPQCWEQSTSEYEQKRILVAESCGNLSRHVEPGLRLSLLFSILYQLEQDSEPTVRISVLENMAKLLYDNLDDSPQKYSQVEDLVYHLLSDHDDEVKEKAEQILLPVFSDWCDRLGVFHEKFLENLSKKIIGAYENNEPEFIDYLYSAKKVMQNVKESILRSKFVSGNDYKPCGDLNGKFFSEEVENELMGKFNIFITESNNLEDWGEYMWLTSLVDCLINMLVSIDMEKQEFSIVLDTLKAIGKYMGSVFTVNYIQPSIEKEMENEGTVVTKLQLSYYYIVVPLLNESEIVEKITELIVETSKPEDSLMTQDVLEKICVKICDTYKYVETIILQLLCEMIVHDDSDVRLVVVGLFGELSKQVLHENLIASRVLPAIIAMSKDEDKEVRYATIACLGDIASNSSNNDTLSKIQFQIESILFEGNISRARKESIVDTLGSIIPFVVSSFRDDFILQVFSKIAEENNQLKSESKKKRMAEKLLGSLESYNTLTLSYQTKENLLNCLTLLPKDILSEESIEKYDILMDKVRDNETEENTATSVKLEEMKNKYTHEFKRTFSSLFDRKNDEET
eukprot:TRINITY_DN12128_c0_g1_i1.p1 TRINITY_DN12128_c0_g1~~TRINITY_DN12128_c0_g1_i1.p1  ORF type:complete len:992 (+),score=263.26 TRINITY_DN12128_c0_g1_i1:66-3041(+)